MSHEWHLEKVQHSFFQTPNKTKQKEKVRLAKTHHQRGRSFCVGPQGQFLKCRKEHSYQPNDQRKLSAEQPDKTPVPASPEPEMRQLLFGIRNPLWVYEPDYLERIQ